MIPISSIIIVFSFICQCRQVVHTPLTKNFYPAPFASMRLQTSQCHLFFGIPSLIYWCPPDVFPARLRVPTKRCPCLLLQGIAAVGWQSFRPYTCSQCGKRFVSLNGLRLHEDLHKGRYRYKWSYCGKGFASLNGLRLHEDLHKGRYRYKCSYCGKGFSGSTNLRDHLVTHTGVKEFCCKLCEREFRYARQLRQHVEVQHGVLCRAMSCEHCTIA